MKVKRYAEMMLHNNQRDVIAFFTMKYDSICYYMSMSIEIDSVVIRNEDNEEIIFYDGAWMCVNDCDTWSIDMISHCIIEVGCFYVVKGSI